MGKVQFNNLIPVKVRHNGSAVSKMYVGAEQIWSEGPTTVPKIDPAHMLANRATMKHLELGALQGMTEVGVNYRVVDNAFASVAHGSLAMAYKALPATSPKTLRISALIKIDKTSGRYSRVGYIPNSASPNTATPDVWIGHSAGSGIQVNGQFGGTISLPYEVLPEAKCVDGAWYRVTLMWDSILHQDPAVGNPGPNRLLGAIEPVDPANKPAAPWHVMTDAGAKTGPTYIPQLLKAVTNSPLGTIRDLAYVDSLYGINGDNAPIYTSLIETTTPANSRMWTWSKAKTAPLRIIITAGGSGLYGGGAWANGLGYNTEPYEQWRTTWRRLADLGYTVLHTTALHEGWGANDHLLAQQHALNLIQAQFGGDARLYYLGYSMGGLSAWRALMGKAGYPSIRAAYIVAGAIGLDRYYDVGSYSQIKTRWPDRAQLDAPENFSGADLVARGTRVRLVTSTGDTNIPKAANHDVMKAKYAGSPLFSELVHTGINHFDPLYWDANDMATFFETDDLN